MNVDLAKYRESATYIADQGYYLDRMAEVLAACELPYPQSLAGIDQWTAGIGSAKLKGYHFSSALLPDLSRASELTAANVAKIRAAQAGLAVARYRREHANVLPDSLQILVPQFLPEVPLDPFDGRPLRYQKSTKSGFVVYSLGPDRQDHGGTPRPIPFKTGVPYDVTFTVTR